MIASVMRRSGRRAQGGPTDGRANGRGFGRMDGLACGLLDGGTNGWLDDSTDGGRGGRASVRVGGQ